MLGVLPPAKMIESSKLARFYQVVVLGGVKRERLQVMKILAGQILISFHLIAAAPLSHTRSTAISHVMRQSNHLGHVSWRGDLALLSCNIRPILAVAIFFCVKAVF
jgi:hypothetical protein